MQWNPLVPELSVSDFKRSLRFYVDGVGFSVAYTRSDPDFAYLDLDNAQLMLEADHSEAWTTGSLDAPRGRGMNLQIEVSDVRSVRDRLVALGAESFREVRETWYETADGHEGQLEYLVLDPDGYLIRLIEPLSTRAEAMIRPCLGTAEYPELVEIWRSAVLATHDFLEEADFDRIEGLLASDYFPAVTLIVAERNGSIVGFAGVADGSLEMLFVSHAARGTGIGTALLSAAVTNHDVLRVDVNEQNLGALGFYLSHGFTQVGRSELDGDGRPYPILHLALQG